MSKACRMLLIRFKFSLTNNSLVQRNRTSFYSFPNFYPEHRAKWSECIGRAIYSSIDSLWQELWWVLCRYGQSQVMYPKSTIKMSVSPFFSYYLMNNLTNDGIPSEVVARSKQQWQIQSSVVYQSSPLLKIMYTSTLILVIDLQL
jgi:hypothetical protein